MTSFKRLTAMTTLRCFIATAAFASPVYAADAPSHAPMFRIDVSAPGPNTRALTDDALTAIHAGMSAPEVLEKIGAPSGKMRFARSATTAWDYPYQDSWGYTSAFSVILDDNGIVVSKVSVRQGSA
jgi:outer membrane protein assembly factor BamE (lipoprotein component of BamABCDE complex)